MMTSTPTLKSFENASSLPNSTALLNDLSNGIGQLGVELADVLGNLHFVADRVSHQSAQFGHLTEAATTMVEANRNIDEAARAVQTATSSAVADIGGARDAVDSAAKH